MNRIQVSAVALLVAGAALATTPGAFGQGRGRDFRSFQASGASRSAAATSASGTASTASSGTTSGSGTQCTGGSTSGSSTSGTGTTTSTGTTTTTTGTGATVTSSRAVTGTAAAAQRAQLLNTGSVGSVAAQVNAANQLQLQWTGNAQAVRSITFGLFDANGQMLASQVVTSLPVRASFSLTPSASVYGVRVQLMNGTVGTYYSR